MGLYPAEGLQSRVRHLMVFSGGPRPLVTGGVPRALFPGRRSGPGTAGAAAPGLSAGGRQAWQAKAGSERRAEV